MKIMIFLVSLTIPVMVGIMVSGYLSSAQLNTAQEDANAAAHIVATAEEWEAFRNESELKIKVNEIRITELNVKMKKPGEIFDAYEKKRTNLEQQNREMWARLVAYEKSQTNWESFKREFNHDMHEIGQAMKDLTVANKN
jgi:hypothetical protein